MFPEPQSTRNIATARDGRVRFAYELFEGKGMPNRFQVWKGGRCLLEIFDANTRVPYALPLLIDQALTSGRTQQDSAASLSGIEKFVCLVLGRGADWAGDPQDLPERARAVESDFFVGRRRVDWRLVRLKGWASPRLLLLVRTRAGGSAPMGSNSTTTVHSFAMSPREAEALRDGLIALRDDPAITRTPTELTRP